jgi:hypothetical protein
MFIYRLSQTDNIGYDTYDSIVVIAASTDDAREILPSPYCAWGERYSSWANSPDSVEVELIGVALHDSKPGLVLISFNAG